MSDGFTFSRFSSACYFCLLLFMVLFLLCLSANTNSSVMLCMDDERQALLEFKHGLIDGADRLASWVRAENSDCCRWVGIVCDNKTGHVHKIHLPGNYCHIPYYYMMDTLEECYEKQKLRGDLSPSLLNLKQLMHLDLSNNNFEGKQIPIFMGSLKNLRYLNLSRSRFGGIIPPQLGNLSELRILSLGSFYERYESFSVTNMQWLSRLRLLHLLDLSGINLSKVIDWLRVIDTLPSLVELHLSNSQLMNIHPHVSSLNLTSLSLLDLSQNDFSQSIVPQWIFSITSLVSLDLSMCQFQRFIPHSSDQGFHNMTSLEMLHASGNYFMNSSFVLKGLSSSNLVLLDISDCGVQSSVFDYVHNLTSLLSLDLSNNQLTNAIPKSLGNLCSMKDIDLSHNSFVNISLNVLLESFFECKSPNLESISIEVAELSSHLPNEIGQLIHLVSLRLQNNRIVGIIPDSIGRLSFLKYLNLDYNLISGQIPSSIGGLSSLEELSVSKNQLNGILPDTIGLLSNLKHLDISSNLLTGVVTDAHFASLNKLKYLKGSGNNLILRPRLANWHPHFQLESLYLSSWDIGPRFPIWLLQQSDLMVLDVRSTMISSNMPLSFWRLFPNLYHLDMSQNHIQGRLFDLPRTLSLLNLSHNQFSGRLPELENGSSMFFLDLSYNSFVGFLDYVITPHGAKRLEILNLANNHLSGAIPNQWDKHPNLQFLNLENNNLFGNIPTSLGSLSSLTSLNMCNNKLSGRLPTSLKNLTELSILQLAKNNFVGRIPTWFGTELSTNLRVLNLRSNYFHGNITHKLCYLTVIQILDLAHNNLSGNIPRCFNNFTILSGKEAIKSGSFTFLTFEETEVIGSASLEIKGRDDIYSTILGLVIIVDLSSNNLSGGIPSEIVSLRALQSLNLSRNQLTGTIPKNIGDLKSLVSFDVSLNHLFGELPASLSSMSFLSSFNVSYNNFTGRVPKSTQLQSFDESSFFGNRLCGAPLTNPCIGVEVLDTNREQDDESHREDWGLIISIVLGAVAGLWIVFGPLILNTSWRIAYFRFLSKLGYIVYDVMYKYCSVMFRK